jgi:pimeloyl-ACP methyl ester carboxylesterase
MPAISRLAKRSPRFRVICPDMRGRGDSAYAKNSSTYMPMQYVADVNACWSAGIGRFIVVGTSLGGLMTMILAMIDPADRRRGAERHRAGDRAGRAGPHPRLCGAGRSFPTWMHAARALEEEHGAVFPDYQRDDWLAMAKRVMVLNSRAGASSMITT